MKKSLLVFASLLLLFSCSDENLSSAGDEKVGAGDLNGRSSYNVTYDDAVNLALSAPELFKTAQTKGGEKKIGECLPILSGPATKGGSSDTLVYLINYADGQGYTFIPKDSRKGDFVAYVEEGSFNLADTAHNRLVRYLYECITNYCKSEVVETKFRDATYDGVYKEYIGDFIDKTGAGCSRVGTPEMYVKQTPTYGEVNMPNMGDYYQTKGCMATVRVREFINGRGVDPLLTTSWGQDVPFNDKAPLIDGYRPPAGCVAAAIVQVLAYHAFPSEYPEDVVVLGRDISGTPTHLDFLRQYRYVGSREDYNGPYFRDYISTIYRFVGDFMKNQWGLSGTGAYLRDSPMCFYRLGYDRKDVNFMIDYDEGKLKSSLDNSWPVLMQGDNANGGAGHAWVVDGYRYLLSGTSKFYFSETGKLDFRRDTFTGPNVPILYINCNFGWVGHSNGFYAGQIFNTSNKPLVETKYTFIKPKIIVNIHP